MPLSETPHMKMFCERHWDQACIAKW